MPNWKKIIISGSDAALNSLNVSTSFTASGLNYPAADNGEESFMQTDGNGNLSLQYVKTIYEEIVNGEATTLIKGTPVYASGSQGAASIVFRADASDPNKMPVIYVAADTLAPTEAGRGIALGLIKGIDTTGFPAGTEIYVAPGGGFTSTRPTGSAIVQVLGYVTKEGNGGQGVVLNPGPNSLPNLPSGSVWVGNSNSIPTAITTSSLSVASASFATQALSASFSVSSSQSVSSSFSSTASFVPGYVSGSGSASQVSFWTGTNSQSGDSGLIWDNVNKRFGIGASPTSTVLLDVRAQGALSTDTAFRVRNSADSANLLSVAGNGNLFLNGVTTITANTTITGSLDVTQNITASTALISSSGTQQLIVVGSGSAQPIFTVQGSQGELFSITDSLSGSLFSVNDISGLPILEVFSDNTTLIGNYQDPMLITTAKVVQTNSGSFTMYSLPTESYDTAFFEYSVRSGSNARAGTIMAIQSGSAVNFTETTTTDFGSTSAISFAVVVTGSNMALTGSSTSGAWTIKTIVRGI
jgi:hypothetical protein